MGLLTEEQQIEEGRASPDVIAYLEKDEIRNVLDLSSLQNMDKRYKLLICRINGEIQGHLSTYDTPEAIYTSLGGEQTAAETLIPFIPKKTVLTTTNQLGELVTRRLTCTAVIPDDIMVVKRGEANLISPDQAAKLSVADEVQYSTFSSSFSASVPMEWIREQLGSGTIFGVFQNEELVAVARLVGRFPRVSEVTGVQTKLEFRNRGFGSIVVSAAVSEGLRDSQVCTLFVRRDNDPAKRLYTKIGFKKVAEELWIDFGTGLEP